MTWASVAFGITGMAAVVAGVAWIYPPAGLIVAGILLIMAHRNLEKVKPNAGKPE